MSTSDIEKAAIKDGVSEERAAFEKGWLGRAIGFAVSSCIVALFGSVYELFSHGVYSYSMIYAFAYLLVGGCVPSLFMARFKRRCIVGATFELYAFALACATAGSVVGGILEIYGSSNRLLPIFYVLAALSAIGSVLLLVIRHRRERFGGEKQH